MFFAACESSKISGEENKERCLKNAEKLGYAWDEEKITYFTGGDSMTHTKGACFLSKPKTINKECKNEWEKPCPPGYECVNKHCYALCDLERMKDEPDFCPPSTTCKMYKEYGKELCFP